MEPLSSQWQLPFGQPPAYHNQAKVFARSCLVSALSIEGEHLRLGSFAVAQLPEGPRVVVLLAPASPPSVAEAVGAPFGCQVQLSYSAIVLSE